MSSVLEAQSVGVVRGGRSLVANVDLRLGGRELVALVGPNGSGKSTLLHLLAGDLRPTSGQVLSDGQPVHSLAPRQLARRRAVLAQDISLPFAFTVRQVVELGRAPFARAHLAAGVDEAAVDAAMAQTDTAHLAERRFPTLSGGERARVCLARVLAQETPLLLLDEPTASLDLHHQQVVLATAARTARTGRGVLCVLHDLNLAAAHADRVVVLSYGQVVAQGHPDQAFTAELLSAVYRHQVEVVPHPRTGRALVLSCRSSAPAVAQ